MSQDIKVNVVESRDLRQKRSADWAVRMFGQNTMAPSERAARFFEEAVELAQACSMTAAEAHRMVDYVFARPAGIPAQEMGGVGTTLLTLAESFYLSADDCEAKELDRVLSKSADHFRARHAAKVEQGIAQPASV